MECPLPGGWKPSEVPLPLLSRVVLWFLALSTMNCWSARLIWEVWWLRITRRHDLTNTWATDLPFWDSTFSGEWALVCHFPSISSCGLSNLPNGSFDGPLLRIRMGINHEYYATWTTGNVISWNEQAHENISWFYITQFSTRMMMPWQMKLIHQSINYSICCHNQSNKQKHRKKNKTYITHYFGWTLVTCQQGWLVPLMKIIYLPAHQQASYFKKYMCHVAPVYLNIQNCTCQHPN